METLEQVVFLREISCNQLQGFYFAKPLDEAALAGYFLSQLVAHTNTSPQHDEPIKIAV